MVTKIYHKEDILAYNKFSSSLADQSAPGVIFLSGYRSDMDGTKAIYLEDYCKSADLSYIRFDYFAHGLSSGDFKQGSISKWLEDVLFILDHIAEKNKEHILVGSSMGGWLMMLAALKRPERIKALIGLAPAPDFTNDIFKNNLEDTHHKQLKEQGYIETPCAYSDEPYIFTQKLFDDGTQHLLLNDKINIHCPVRILHGTEDQDVPLSKALKIKDCLQSKDVKVLPIEGGDHRLSRAENLALLSDTIKELILLDAPKS